MSIKTWLLDRVNDTKRNLPSILTGVGIFNMLLGTGLAVKATPEAMRQIEKKKEEEGHDQLTFTQTVQAVWKCYVAAAVAELTGAGCIVGGLAESNKRQAALALLADSAQVGLREFREYRKYVAEQIGERKEAEIHSRAIQQSVQQTSYPPEMMNRTAPEGTAPKPECCDAQFGRYFYATYEEVQAAVNKLNQRITTSFEGYVSLNDFYDEIHVNRVKAGDLLGWSMETGLIEIPEKEDLDCEISPSGWPCWVLEFLNPPQYEYKYFRKH